MNIFWKEAGTGIPVVFLHGFCETHEIWEPFCNSISADHNVILIDLPGFGKSKIPDNEFSLDDIAFTIRAFLVEKGINKHIVIGHSLGGYIALSYSRLFPETLLGLGLFHSSVFEDSEDKKEIRNKLVEFIRSHGVKPFIKTFIPSLFSEKNISRLGEVISQLKSSAENIKDISVIRYAEAMRDRKSSVDFLKSFVNPVMFIIGEDDGSVPIQKSLEQVTIPPNSHFLRLTDTGHMGMFERPKETGEFITGFLNFCIKKG